MAAHLSVDVDTDWSTRSVSHLPAKLGVHAQAREGEAQTTFATCCWPPTGLTHTKPCLASASDLSSFKRSERLLATSAHLLGVGCRLRVQLRLHGLGDLECLDLFLEHAD